MSPLFKSARVRLYEEASKDEDHRSTTMEPEEFARPQPQEVLVGKRKPGWKARKRGKERKDKSVLQQELHAARRDDMLERQLRDKREAAGRSLAPVEASGSDRNMGVQTPGCNDYGQIAPQIYRDESECALISKRGTVRYELPAEEEPRPRQPDGVSMRPQRYDSPYYGIEYGRQLPWTVHWARTPSSPPRKNQGQGGVATHGSVHNELHGDMPPAHLSNVTARGPYELPVPQQNHRRHPQRTGLARSHSNSSEDLNQQLSSINLNHPRQVADSGPVIQRGWDRGLQQPHQTGFGDQVLQYEATEGCSWI